MENIGLLNKLGIGKYLKKVKEYVDANINKLYIETTYSNLVNLRNNSQLIPGQQYRITDYVTTTAYTNTQSAGHQFDVIVTADDVNLLNEVARVILHDGDTYFADSDLNAWQIWYCLDNDTNRFAWADATSGKGVIYRMIDEFANDCPYDFKNMRFEHPKDTTTYPDYYYTFSTVISGVVTDHSLLQSYCYDNTMKARIMTNKQRLNNNVFLNTSKTSWCYSNSFGNDCYNNSFGSDCYSNSFGNRCYINSFGNECNSNSFGSNCYSNSFGNRCYINSFGSECYSNSFGNDCYNNSFGSDCYSNSFGNNCYSNSFGNNCYSNSFGNVYDANSFGNVCKYNSFRVSASKTSTLKDYVQYNHFDDGCSYNVIWNSDTISSSVNLKNINVNRGVAGTSSAYNYINIDTLSSEQEINVNQVDGIVSVGDILSISYESLKTLRDNSELIPGRHYRIADYVTTTYDNETQSAGHEFDVIVTADGVNTLNEVARACLHDGDTYFANSDLNAWQLWYCLDNDTNRFDWADETYGKGVIYRMIDEFGNDCPYDFKNIRFEHPKDTITYPYYYYTFSTVIDGSVTDHSLLQGYCYGNTMKTRLMLNTQSLNNNVFLNTSEASSCISNSFGYGCYDNSFGDSCFNNSFGYNCGSNSFGDSCFNNSLGNVCGSNSFGNYINFNIFEDYCRFNSFGNFCNSNSFGYTCDSNSFGNQCTNNSFGNTCKNNSFGDSCGGNSFENRCNDNSFGNGCGYNSFRNACDNNSFGDLCVYNSFGNGCDNNSFRVSADTASALNGYVQNNHFDDGCSYNVIWNSNTTGSANTLQNININRGVVGTSSAYNYINIDTLNAGYEIQVAKNSSGVIKIYCEADLIA